MRVEEVLSAARRALSEHVLCDSCLGRLFGMLGYGLTNRERGFALKTLLLMGAYDALKGETDVNTLRRLALSGFRAAQEALRKLRIEDAGEGTCELCGGLLERLDDLAALCVDAGRDYEYETFQVGCSIPLDVVRREEALWLKLGIASAESLKSELTREIGKRVAATTGKAYSLKSPDVVFIVDVAKWSVTVQARPLYIYGRYRKLVRGLPQNPWLYEPDRRVSYASSVEELITGPLLEVTRGDGAKLHAAGREDLDVRTLGNGRPFVVEVRNPKVRRIDLRAAERLINERAGGLIEVEGLQFVDGKLVPRLKAYSEIARKTYVARVRVGRELGEEDLKVLREKLSGAVISQRTPLRVLGRKVDKVRKKVVYSVEARLLAPTLLELTVTCQGGLYVKELIHGDEGRTRPSVSEILGTRAEVEELDIVYVEEPAVVQQYVRPAG